MEIFHIRNKHLVYLGCEMLSWPGSIFRLSSSSLSSSGLELVSVGSIQK